MRTHLFQFGCLLAIVLVVLAYIALGLWIYLR